jgi:hypothetical protein
MIGSSFYRCSFAAKMARANRTQSERRADNGVFEADRRRAALLCAGHDRNFSTSPSPGFVPVEQNFLQ